MRRIAQQCISSSAVWPATDIVVSLLSVSMLTCTQLSSYGHGEASQLDYSSVSEDTCRGENWNLWQSTIHLLKWVTVCTEWVFVSAFPCAFAQCQSHMLSFPRLRSILYWDLVCLSRTVMLHCTVASLKVCEYWKHIHPHVKISGHTSCRWGNGI